MKTLPSGLVETLSTGAVRLCLCWRFTRLDGGVFGATDHDRDLVFDGVTFRAQAGLAPTSLVSGDGLAPGQASGAGALSADFLDADDLAAGVWDGARVDVYRVDWTTPDNRVHLWGGRMGEISMRDDAFHAELVSLKADLERPIGRVYNRSCDAALGDARCGVDLFDPVFRIDAIVDDVQSSDQLQISALGDFADGWFSQGRLIAHSGAVYRIASQAGTVVTLARAGVFAPAEAVTLIAGCDKTFATCRDKFANTDNFRGFPHLPGMDAVLSGPVGDGSDDGGKR